MINNLEKPINLKITINAENVSYIKELHDFVKVIPDIKANEKIFKILACDGTFKTKELIATYKNINKQTIDVLIDFEYNGINKNLIQNNFALMKLNEHEIKKLIENNTDNHILLTKQLNWVNRNVQKSIHNLLAKHKDPSVRLSFLKNNNLSIDFNLVSLLINDKEIEISQEAKYHFNDKIRFENIFCLSHNYFQKVMSNINLETLAIALYRSKKEHILEITTKLSKRLACRLDEEFNLLSFVSHEKIIDAQNTIKETIQQLSLNHEIDTKTSFENYMQYIEKN